MILGIFSSLIASGITTGFKYREQLWKRFLWNVLYRNKTIRVSIASIIKIEYKNKVLLIRNINRPELFSPIGGVNKYFSSAKQFLNKIEWEDEVPKKSIDKESLHKDLRGYIPAKHLFSLLKWYLSAKDREENSLYREIKEELNEIGLTNVLLDLEIPQFSLLRRISEGPISINGKSYKQFRLFNIYEFSNEYKISTKFESKLIKKVKTNDNLILVDFDEIIQGRAKSSKLIGSNSDLDFK